MSEILDRFDPYHKWLGIPPADQPPNLYRLLGVTVFEDDVDVVASAADRQMAHIRTFQTGQHSADSQKLLNELAAARLCLLKPAEKAAYDSQLRRQLAPPQAAPSQPAPPQPLPVQMVSAPRPLAAAPSVRWAQAPVTMGVNVRSPSVVEPRVVIDKRRASSRARTYRRRSSGWPMAGVVTLAGVIFAGCVIWKGYQERSRPRVPEISKVRPTPKTPPDDLDTALKQSSDEDPQEPNGKPLNAVVSIDRTLNTTDDDSADDGHASDEDLEATQPPAANVPEPRETTDKRLPIPPSDLLDQARKSVDDRYGAELKQAKAPLEAVTLAKKLIDDSLKAEDDAALRYALLETARDVAAAVGAAEAAMSAIEQMAEQFIIDDEVALKLATLAVAAEATLNPRTKGEQLKAARELIDEAVDLDRYDEAKKATALADAAAIALEDDDAKKQIRESRADVEKFSKRYKNVKASLAKLEITPDDADDNLKVGEFYCFIKGDWDRGLTYLAKGGKERYRELAKRDLNERATPTDQRALGDAWFAASRGAGTLKPVLAGRAAHWYSLALPRLVDADRPAVEDRLKEINAPPVKGRTPKSRKRGVPTVDLLKLINVQAPGTHGEWRVENQRLIAPQVAWASIGIPYVPPKDYRLKIAVGCLRHDGPFQVGLVVGERQVVVAIDANGKSIKKVSGLADVNGHGPNDSGMGVPGLYLGNGAVNIIECVVRENRVQVWCNGTGIVNWTGNLETLALPRYFAGRHAGQLFVGIGGTPSPFVVTAIGLTPLEKGK